VAAGVLAAALSHAAAACAEARSWRAPVAGEVVARFSYSAARPFAAGQRRGIDLAAPLGSVVGAACAGRVAFAGRLPGGARGASVRCGALTATHVGLARVAVRRGATVRAGSALGTVGRSGRVRLGARVTARRFGYIDPLGLIGADRPAPPVAPLGRAPAPLPAPVAEARRPASRPAARLVVPPAPDAPAAAAAIPRAAWAGLVLLAAGVPLGGVVQRARRHRAAPIPSRRWFASSPSSRP
jgi:hypothetical protein